ncbi:MAG: hypothetical protein Q7S06_00880 [Nanoarchaeota archaeon]|nr:hypothetical protein [Nanoarchaeota archaeon]
MKIKAIIFDIGGVLTEDSLKNEFFKKWTGTKENKNKTKELRTQFGSGNMSIEEFISQGSKLMDMDEATFLSEYNKAYGTMNPRKSVYKLFLNLKIPKYILSDTNPIHAPLLKKNLKDIFSSANAVWLSNEIKMRKVDSAIFKFVINEIKLPSEQILFIDNNEEIIEIAKNTGINTILYKNDKQLFRDLKKSGVK